MIDDIECDEEFQTDVINKDGYVFVDFYADWCRPCKMMDSTIEAADEELGDRMTFCRANVETLKKTVDELDLMGIPAFLIYKDGEEIRRITGYYPREHFIDMINKCINIQ